MVAVMNWPVDPREVRQIVRMAIARTGSAVDDEDLTQDAVLHAIEAFQRTESVRYPRAFLTKIVIDTVRDHWRGRRLTEDLDSVDEQKLSQTPHFEDDIDLKRRSLKLRAAIAALDESKRQIIEMFYIEERSVGEIARTRSRSVSAIKMELARARGQLANALEILADKQQKKSR